MNETEQLATGPNHEKAEALTALNAYFEGRKAHVLNVIARIHSEKAYHNREHTELVMKLCELIIEKVNECNLSALSEVDEIAIRFSALYHDLIMNAEKGEDGKMIRAIGQNESESLGYLHRDLDRWLEEMSEKDDRPGYQRELQSLVVELKEKSTNAIQATVPEFSMETMNVMDLDAMYFNGTDLNDSEKRRLNRFLGKFNSDSTKPLLKVGQKYVTNESTLPTIILAISDLIAVGIVIDDEAAKIGDAEFRELEFIHKERAGELADISKEDAQDSAKRMLAWMNTQVGFILWQRNRFAEMMKYPAIATLPGLSQRLNNLFGQFEGNIDKAISRTNNASQEYTTLLDNHAFEGDRRDEDLKTLGNLFNEMGIQTNQ